MKMLLGIVGSEAKRWTFESEIWARRRIIQKLLELKPTAILVSDNDGVTNFAREEARNLDIEVQTLPLAMTEISDRLLCIAARSYAAGYRNRRRYCELCGPSVERHVHNVGCIILDFSRREYNKTTEIIVVGR